ncbi:hypothetical protein L211DRAFT_848553 [Terfezia boudieri ATCC MYA-4762]|uniref:F-box domain-containing protein n=1 Tax=Terfezia boudieri ATCC MYA-4762 TaxID=1051890 RepID=A0A3N4LPE2_9PEZI|nr:hypothetical protein L211DRAFT_848553 [Terfezia boudieri ATCC MYA-4762]
MTRSADFISFDFVSCTLADADGKVHLDVEDGDDYNPEEDLCESSQSTKFDCPVRTPLRQSDLVLHTTATGKRRADGQGESCGPPDDVKRPRLTPPSTSKALTLPEVVWAGIFSRLPPQKLAQLRRTCRAFQNYLLNQSIWRASRKQWMPEMPKPAFNLKEWEMLALARGDGCMICGHKAYTRAVYWAFRESALSESDLPIALLTALPFGFIDASGQWVPNAMVQCPGGGLTKVYWNADLKSIKERYDEAKAMNAEEEWLKGLESEGIEHKIDIIRMETFESRRAKGKSIANFPKTLIQGANHAAKTKVNWHQLQGNSSIAHSPQAHHFSPSIHPGMMQMSFPPRQHAHSSPVMFPTQQGPLTAGGSWPGTFNGQPALPKQHPQVRTPATRNERSMIEAAEVRARRQMEIEARCLKLNPPLLPNVLQHIPAFKASIVIAIPLNEQAWGNLLPKLLEQREEAEEKERVKAEGQIKLQKQIEEKRACDTLQRELKEKKEREWEESQAPVKEKLDQYATEIINLWLSRTPVNQHPNVNRESALRFAPEVLVQVRRRFYDENPYTPQDPNHYIMLDPNSAHGATTLDTPSGKRLMLENMKYVFDTKIKPITDQVRKELFLCSGCESSPKFYGFEGVIQHYAAKHTNLMSLGSVIVHWKSDWPYCPPFVLDPVAAASGLKHMSHASHRQQFQVNNNPNATSTFGSYNTTHMGMHMSAQMEISHQTMISNGYPNEGAYLNGIYRAFPVSHQQYPAHQHDGSMMQTINLNTPIQALVPPTFASYQQQSGTQRAQLEEIAATAREAWFQLNGIKDLPSSVRVHYVIRKVVKAFQAKFPPLLPQLNIFIEALREHNLMKPMRNVNGLQCLACIINPPHLNSSSTGIHPIGRVFTLISLIQHFEIVHVVRNRSPIKMDWKTQMIKLPEARVIGMLRDAMGMDEEKLKLLKEVFPVAFNLPLPMRSTGGFVPSPGPFPKPSQSATPSSSIAPSSPSPLRSVGTKEASPIAEQLSQSPNSLETPSPSPTQKMMKRELSLEAELRKRRALVVKQEASESTSETRPLKRTHLRAAETFLETFMGEGACGDTGFPEVAAREVKQEFPELAFQQKKNRKHEDEEIGGSEIVPLVRPITPRSESPPSPRWPKQNSVGIYSKVLGEYNRQSSPGREEEFRHRPASPFKGRYRNPEGHPGYLLPLSPRPRSPRRGRSSVIMPEERGRALHARPCSPHSRSRSPRLRYLPPHHAELYYNRDYRVELCSRDPLHYARDYIPRGYIYRERSRGSVRPLSRHRTIPADSRCYDVVYENARYVDEIIGPTMTARERSKSPPAELSSRSQPIPRDYKYVYAPSAAHHAPPYYLYPLPAAVPSPYLTYIEESRYARETRSHSPIYGIERAPPAPPRGQEQFEDEEEYLMERRYRERDMIAVTRGNAEHPDTQNHHTDGKYDDAPVSRRRALT